MRFHPYRFEFKYLMTRFAAEHLERELRRFGFTLDGYSPAPEGYWVTSLYFDSYDLKDYYDKSGGFLERKKLRARIYEPYLSTSPSILLELKEKRDAQVRKARLTMNREEWKRFMDRGVSALVELKRSGGDRKAQEAIAWNMISSSAKPWIVVRYLRTPYVASGGKLRVTFDSRLEACRKADLGYSEFMVPVLRDHVILEIKAQSHTLLPRWLNTLIRKYDLNKDAISKYAYAVEAVREYHPLPR